MPLPVHLDQVVQDARAGARILKTSPGLSATAILLIALVIGGNITIYSMVRTLLTKPAPGVEADRLVAFSMTVNGRVVEPFFSHPDYLDFVAQSATVQPILSADAGLYTLTLDSGTYSVRGSSISANYFETLGVRLARGRGFTEAESRLDGSGLVAVISDRVWEDNFQHSEDVLGRPITLNGHTATIVGVASPRFQGPMLGDQVGIWVPMEAWARVRGTEALLVDRARPAALIIGRLAEGRSLSDARAEFAAISGRLQNVYPQLKANTVFSPIPYSMTAGGNSIFAMQAPRFLAIFSVVTVLTLGIVCANIANLLLARIVARQRELAVRLSLGASRTRVLRLLVAEGLTLSLIATLAAFGLAWWVSRAIVGLLTPEGANPLFNVVDFTPDWRVAGYATLLAVAGAIAFTLAPASRAWRQDLLSFLKAGEQGIVAGRSRLAAVLAVVQLAFAVLLLTCAGLAYRSLSLIETSDLGFDPAGLLIVSANTTGSASGPEDNAILIERLRERLLTVPGVTSAASVGTVPPFGGIMELIRVTEAGPPAIAERNFVGAGYFELLGTPPVAGRTFSRDDGPRASAIAVVNQNLADSLWPGQSPLGRTVLYGERREPVEIVGVVPNSQYVGFRPDPRQHFIFLLDRQRPRPPGLVRFYVRYSSSLDQVAPAIRASIRDLDARVPIIAMARMEVALSTATSPVRAIATMLTLFASASLLVAAVGLYGVIAFNIRRRTRDFGVRLALGASSQQVLRSVLGEGLLLTTGGVCAGFVLSVLAGLALRRLLLGVTPTDPPTYLAVFVLLAMVSLAASFVPARRASRVNPVQALRQE